MKALAGIVVVVALFAIRWVWSDLIRNRLSTATGKAPSCLAMLGSTTGERDGANYIVGSIRNDCDRKFSSVTIMFNLERPSGRGMSLPDAPTQAYASDVEPGQTRQFKSKLPVGKNTVYRFDGINAY